MNHFTRRAVVSASVAGLALLPGAVASADLGVGIQSDPIVAAGPIEAGSAMAIPAVYVENTGTEPSAVSVRVNEIDDGSQRNLIPPEWVTFNPPLVDLEVGKGTRIAIRVAIPGDAEPGEYGSHIIAASDVLSTDDSPTGARLGAQAATKLELTVTSAGTPFWDRIDLPMWALVALGVGAGVAVLAIFGRLLGFRLRIQRQ